MKLTVEWEVEDGYIGKTRPQSTIVDTDDYVDQEEWEALTLQEKREIIEEAVQEDFENRISYSINNYGI